MRAFGERSRTPAITLSYFGPNALMVAPTLSRRPDVGALAAGRGGGRIDAARGELDQVDVVATDPDGHQLGVLAQGGELRRSG